MDSLGTAIKPGVALGEEVSSLYAHARYNEYAFPAVNVIGTQPINATLEAAQSVNSPVII